MTQSEVNATIFQAAQKAGASIWLQLRLYDNQLAVPSDDAQPKNYTAAEILDNPSVQKAFDAKVDDVVGQYLRYYSDSCRIVIFEEAGIYHSPQGGGYFWSSSREKRRRPTAAMDRIFADRLSKIFTHVANRIKQRSKSCSVGLHLGHSAFGNDAEFTRTFASMTAADAKPAFLFYDFYLESQLDFESYARKLEARAAMTKGIGLPFYHLAQLHTMNNFHHGLGRTPSRSDLNRIVDLDLHIGVAGLGFYTKNASKTSIFDNKPFAPNEKAQKTVFESSKDRWEYGCFLLAYSANPAFPGRTFDLVLNKKHVEADGEDVYLRSVGSGDWTFVGALYPPRRSGEQAAVIRFLPIERFASPDGKVQVKIGSKDRVALEPDEVAIVREAATPDAFRTDAELSADGRRP